jgi:hypothetical protein
MVKKETIFSIIKWTFSISYLLTALGFIIYIIINLDNTINRNQLIFDIIMYLFLAVATFLYWRHVIKNSDKFSLTKGIVIYLILSAVFNVSIWVINTYAFSNKKIEEIST